MTKVLTEDALRQAESHAAVAETILEASPRIVPSLRAKLHTDTAIMLRALVSERDALAGRVAELEAERDAAAKRAPDFAEFVDETDSTLEMVKRTFGNRGTPPDMLEGFATLTMVEQLLKQCEQVRAALSTTPESKP